MKKIFIIFVCSLVCLINSYSQSIQNTSITSPILCNGELADINILINQTSPPTILKLVVGYYPFPGVFVPITSTNNTTVAWVRPPKVQITTSKKNIIIINLGTRFFSRRERVKQPCEMETPPNAKSRPIKHKNRSPLEPLKLTVW